MLIPSATVGIDIQSPGCVSMAESRLQAFSPSSGVLLFLVLTGSPFLFYATHGDSLIFLNYDDGYLVLTCV